MGLRRLRSREVQGLLLPSTPGALPPIRGVYWQAWPGFAGRGGSPVGTRADIVPTFAEKATIAVAIPCYNEAAAVEAVVASWRSALPGAEVVVFDNNSTDGTGAIARRLGVRVVEVREQG